MPLAFALWRTILLFFIVTTNVVSSALAAISVHEQAGGVFQALVICVNIISLLTVIGSLHHQCIHRDEETTNTRNLCLFGICGLLGLVLAISLTVHVRQDGAMGICKDFARAGNPCILAGVQLGMMYVTTVFASVGLIVSWIDKFPGAVKVMPRYPITKAPSSQFAAFAHDLDMRYTPPPVKISRPRNDTGWSDIPLHG